MNTINEVYVGPHDSNSLMVNSNGISYTEYTKEHKDKYYVPSSELQATMESVFDCSVDTHHKYHLCTALYSYDRPFEGIGLVVDGFGQCTSEKVYSITRGNIDTLYSDKLGISIGNLWNILGITYFDYPMVASHGKAGTMMALAATGSVDAKLFSLLQKAYTADIFTFLQPPASTDEFQYLINNKKVRAYFGEVGGANICATLQDFTNQTILTKLEPYVSAGDTVMFAGGVAHNVVLIKFLEDTLGITLFTGFAQGDEGLALGKYLYDKHIANKEEYAPQDFRSPYSDTEEETELAYVDITNDLEVYGITAIYNAGPEIGNRALGHRSFLANPRFPQVKQKLDALKNRESFRPYGVMVLATEWKTWFDKEIESPYMNKIGVPNEHFKALFPSIIHIDGTVRVQTVTEDIAPEMFNLLNYIKVVMGYGVLINTSLNISTPMLYRGDEHKVKAMVDKELINSCYINGEVYERSR